MSILYTNVRSVVNKHVLLSSAIDICSAHIIALTETWLSAHIHDSEIFHDAHHYFIYRCDHTDRRGGGVLLAISKQIPSSSIPIHSDLEITYHLRSVILK